jgi:hypothetical protein
MFCPNCGFEYLQKTECCKRRGLRLESSNLEQPVTPEEWEEIKRVTIDSLRHFFDVVRGDLREVSARFDVMLKRPYGQPADERETDPRQMQLPF